MARPFAIGSSDVAALELGVRLLGSGGGGATRVPAHLLRQAMGGDQVPLNRPGDLPGLHVVPVGIVGSTAVFEEKLPSGTELVTAVRAVTRWTGRPADAVMNIEAGGVNAMVGMVAARQLGVPFLDADLMGRALPRLDQLSWAVEGRGVTPCVLADPSGATLLLDRADAVTTERVARSFLTVSSGWATLALPPMPMRQVAEVSIIGSVHRALRLGQALASLPPNPPSEHLERALDGRVLGRGRVRGVSRYATTAGFGRGNVIVVTDTGSVIRVETENEHLLALVDGAVAAATPQIICLLDTLTRVPLGVDEIRAGDEVVVVVLDAPDYWTSSPHREEKVRPSAYGLGSVDLRALA